MVETMTSDILPVVPDGEEAAVAGVEGVEVTFRQDVLKTPPADHEDHNNNGDGGGCDDDAGELDESCGIELICMKSRKRLVRARSGL